MFMIEFMQGFFMALADSVPGVSGGTVAFLLGFYDKFIIALDNLFSKSKKNRNSAIIYLSKLGVGWIIGFGLAIIVLSNIFENNIYIISSVFLGFIIFAIPIVMKEERSNINGHYINIIYTIIGILVVGGITYFNPISGAGITINLSSLNLGVMIYIFLAGAIAISAMVLPGISGSTLLLIFGLYIPIINAIKEVITLNFRYLPLLIVFGLGVIIGIVTVVKLIKILLERFRSQIIFLIIGLMIGSLYAIVMGPTTLEVPLDYLSWDKFSIVGFIIGGIIIIGMQQIKSRRENN